MSTSSQADIDDYGAEYVIAPASGGPAFYYDELPGTLVFSDGNFHTLASVTFTCNGSQKVKATWSADFKSNAVNRGVHADIKEGSSFIYPPDGSSGNDWLVIQTTETQIFSMSYIFVPAAGQHTWDFTFNAALAITTITVKFACLSIEIYD